MNKILNRFINFVKFWYQLFLLGIVFIFIGIYLLDDPLKAYLVLSVLFGFLFLVSGLLDIIFSVENQRILNDSGWYLIGGLVSAIMGGFLIIYPEVSEGLLPFVLSFTVLLRSFQLLGFSLDLDIGRSGNKKLRVVGVSNIIFSFILIFNPLSSSALLVMLIASAFIVAGIVNILLAYSLEKIEKYPRKIKKESKNKIRLLKQKIS